MVDSVSIGTAEVLRILYKHYGGIDWFEDKPSFLLGECLDNGIKKETELPKLINEIVKKLSHEKSFVPQLEQKPKKKMRSAEDIMKDYGLGGVKLG